jgi:hypothetical protein
MRAVFCVVASLLAMPTWAADGTWRVTRETPAEVVAIDLASFQRSAALVSFRVRHTLRGGQIDPGSLRPVREVLARRVADCAARRIATLSRAVFSDGDALIDHQATRLRQAVWQPLAPDDVLFRQVCGRS